MNFIWNRFDKLMPPNDTDIMVSNGPAMGHYHFNTETYLKHCGKEEGHCGGATQAFVPLWSLDGVRVECPVKDLTQWSKLLVSDVKRTPSVKLTRWQRFKNWLKGKL